MGKVSLVHWFSAWSLSVVACGIRAPSSDDIAHAKASVPTLHVSYEMQLERFDPITSEFEQLPPPPTERGLPLVVTSRGRIFVLGGLDAQGDYRSAVDVYDPGTGQWSSAAPWPHPRSVFPVEVDGLICVIGGFRSPTASVDSVECLDVDANTWRIGQPLPDGPISSFWPVVQQGKIYILGGAQLSLDKWIDPLTTAYAYDPVRNSWADLEPLPTARAGATVHSIADRIYVVGGFGAQTQDSSEDDGQMLIYEPDTQTWSAGPNSPTTRLLYGADTLADQIITYFGVGADHVLDRFDSGSGVWRAGAEPTSPLDPGVYSSVVRQDSLYVLVLADRLTSSGTSASGKLWRYDLASDDWSLAGQRPAEARDADFAGVALANGLYFVGALTNLND